MAQMIFLCGLIGTMTAILAGEFFIQKRWLMFFYMAVSSALSFACCVGAALKILKVLP